MVRMSDRLVISLVLALGVLWHQACAMASAMRCTDPRVSAPAVARDGPPLCPKESRQSPCPAPCSVQPEIPAIPDPARPQTPAPQAEGVSAWVEFPALMSGPSRGGVRAPEGRHGPPSRARLCVWNN
jgi:hypothetical protein